MLNKLKNNLIKVVSVIFTIIFFLGAFNILQVTAASEHVERVGEDSNEPLSLDTLSSKTGVECIEVLENYGLELPEVYREDKELAAISVKTIISDLDSGVLSNEAIPYNYTELVKLAWQIRSIVEEYDPTYKAAYLQDSTVIGSWNNSYLNYNCYGYALERSNSFVNPGAFSNQSFSMGLSISAMADLVRDDLNSLGFYSTKSSTKPSSLASYVDGLICIRKGNADFHFMRGTNSTTYWTHKPGNTNPLKWNYSSPGAKIWTNEAVFQNNYIPSTTTYTSEIYYIQYWSKSGPGPSIQRISGENE